MTVSSRHRHAAKQKYRRWCHWLLHDSVSEGVDGAARNTQRSNCNKLKTICALAASSSLLDRGQHVVGFHRFIHKLKVSQGIQRHVRVSRFIWFVSCLQFSVDSPLEQRRGVPRGPSVSRGSRQWSAQSFLLLDPLFLQPRHPLAVDPLPASNTSNVSFFGGLGRSIGCCSFFFGRHRSVALDLSPQIVHRHVSRSVAAPRFKTVQESSDLWAEIVVDTHGFEGHLATEFCVFTVFRGDVLFKTTRQGLRARLRRRCARVPPSNVPRRLIPRCVPRVLDCERSSSRLCGAAVSMGAGSQLCVLLLLYRPPGGLPEQEPLHRRALQFVIWNLHCRDVVVHVERALPLQDDSPDVGRRLLL
mmetsp:Transcript_29635/g.43925  ORF Transcript_29635/g.43925 Transcript_29635/m.43925 type:complete len:359 (-) Transcript_29635:43-1119(-)